MNRLYFKNCGIQIAVDVSNFILKEPTTLSRHLSVPEHGKGLGLYASWGCNEEAEILLHCQHHYKVSLKAFWNGPYMPGQHFPPEIWIIYFYYGSSGIQQQHHQAWCVDSKGHVFHKAWRTDCSGRRSLHSWPSLIIWKHFYPVP